MRSTLRVVIDHPDAPEPHLVEERFDGDVQAMVWLEANAERRRGGALRLGHDFVVSAEIERDGAEVATLDLDTGVWEWTP